MIQVVWDAEDPLTREREQRALRQAEQELGFPGKLIGLTAYLSLVKSERADQKRSGG